LRRQLIGKFEFLGRKEIKGIITSYSDNKDKLKSSCSVFRNTICNDKRFIPFCKEQSRATLAIANFPKLFVFGVSALFLSLSYLFFDFSLFRSVFETLRRFVFVSRSQQPQPPHSNLGTFAFSHGNLHRSSIWQMHLWSSFSKVLLIAPTTLFVLLLTLFDLIILNNLRRKKYIFFFIFIVIFRVNSEMGWWNQQMGC